MSPAVVTAGQVAPAALWTRLPTIISSRLCWPSSPRVALPMGSSGSSSCRSFVIEEVIEVMAEKVSTTLGETEPTDDQTDDFEPAVRAYIVNTTSDVWHAARPSDPEVTVCGWRWGESGGAPVCGVPGLECRRCMRICAGRSGD